MDSDTSRLGRAKNGIHGKSDLELCLQVHFRINYSFLCTVHTARVYMFQIEHKNDMMQENY